MHQSYNPLTHEHYVDNFNIDTLRYFRKQNARGAFFGAVLGAFCFYILHMDFLLTNHSLLLLVYLLGLFGAFGIMTGIAHAAGNDWIEAMRIAARRGLFTYAIITFIVLLSLPFFSPITLESTVGETFWYVLNLQAFLAFFTIPFDYGATLLRDSREK